MALPAIIPVAAPIVASAIKVAPEFRKRLNGAERTQVAVQGLKTGADVATALAPVLQTYLAESAAVERTRLACETDARKIEAAHAGVMGTLALYDAVATRLDTDEARLALLDRLNAVNGHYFDTLTRI
jgi:hypothetical protein